MSTGLHDEVVGTGGPHPNMQRRFFLSAIGLIPALAITARTSHAAPQSASGGKPGIRKRQVGIALGGGSMHGIAHVGVLKAFAEQGLEFQVIAGTSAGAIIGVLAAAQFPYDEIDVIARRFEWPGVTSLSWSGKGLLQHTKLRALIDNALDNRRLEQLPIQFAAITTDVATGERVIICSGEAGAAVSASASIPVMFEPVKISGRDLVDGGLTEPVPVLAVREMGADIVIGVDVAFRPYEEQIQGLTGVAFQTMHIMSNALIKEQIRSADIAIQMNLHHFIGKENFHDQLIAAGYVAAMRAWPKIAALLS